jgi:ATP-dependent exoDNAse (exonuclease V) alpha subunit
LVDKLDSFLSNKEESVFLLKGYAGTGKTFITKGLTEYFRAIGRNYVLAAPTGKASKVIAKKTQVSEQVASAESKEFFLMIYICNH